MEVKNWGGYFREGDLERRRIKQPGLAIPVFLSTKGQREQLLRLEMEETKAIGLLV